MSATAHSPLEVLRAHRDAVKSRVGRLTAERRRLSAVEGAEREARAALDALGREEAAAARAWASSGAETSAPPVDAERRRVLTAEVAHAEAATAAARSAGTGIDAELDEASRETANLVLSIERAAVDEMASAFVSGVDALHKLADAFRGEVAKVYANITVIRDLVDDHQTRGRYDEARRLLLLLEHIGAKANFDTLPSHAEVTVLVPERAAHFRGLIA